MNDSVCLSGDSIDYAVGGKQILSMAYVDALPGTVTALVGRSGAGKTTLLEVLVGVRQTQSGRVACFGEPITPGPGSAARQGVAFLPSRRWLPGHLTGRELVELVARIWKVEPGDVAGNAALTDLLAAPVRNLSGGERKLVEIAVVTAGGATTLVLDEPFRHLDPIERERVGRMLRERTTTGTAILFADHDPHMTLAVADRLYRIDKGQTTFVPDFRDCQPSEWYGHW
jgi:ABC-type multidrug transport system ATPase subunit